MAIIYKYELEPGRNKMSMIILRLYKIMLA